jgi:glycosyltransferase involved in cell wall biosynthesis
MASADIFVFPSRTDTAGNVVLEAQASGLPVVVTDRGGPTENLLDGSTGHVCSDIRAFVRRVNQLSWNADLRLSMGRAARQYALSRTWAAALEPLFDTYREVAASREQARPAREQAVAG